MKIRLDFLPEIGSESGVPVPVRKKIKINNRKSEFLVSIEKKKFIYHAKPMEAI